MPSGEIISGGIPVVTSPFEILSGNKQAVGAPSAVQVSERKKTAKRESETAGCLLKIYPDRAANQQPSQFDIAEEFLAGQFSFRKH